MNAPTFDLPSALAAMADYPALLRRLGVIRIIEVDLAGTGIDPAAGPVTVGAKPSWPTKLPAPQVKVAPVTVPAVLSRARFALAADGRLDPVAGQLGVADFDTDSAALRHVDLARQIVNAEDANRGVPDAGLTPVTVPERMSLPSLRNAGLSLYQGDRATALRSTLVTNRALLTAASAHTMTNPQHALKGLVIDVWDDRTRRWHTLCARRGTYTLPGGQGFTLDDEGTVSLAATTRENPGPLSPMYLHQSLMRWTGWSLVAPPPGKPVVTETAGAEPPPGGSALPGFAVTFVPQPASLPLLRFGRGYRFQARTVDVAGQADPLDPTSTDFTRAIPGAGAPPVPYRRFQPVISPLVVASAPMTEGESLETLVIRPDLGLLGGVSSLLAPLLGSPPVRHIAPPKVGEVLCEEHGMFDTSAGRPDPRKYAMIAARDKADLTGVGVADPRHPNQRYVPALSLPVTWLPDPLSRGATIAGLPGGLAKIRFDPPLLQTWPNVQSFRLQIIDGTGGPVWNPLLRVFTVAVPRGETMTVRLSSFVDPGDVALLGQLGWLAESGVPPATLAAARGEAADGRLWQVTPYRTLKLVNAVRVPVEAPSLPALDLVPRTPGSTKQDLTVSSRVHRPSTGQLALVARWADPFDDPEDPTGPKVVNTTASPTDLAVAAEPDPLTGAGVQFAATHVLGDTRRRLVTYSLVGTTRYLEQFAQRGRVTLSGATPVALSAKGIVPGTESVRSADGAVSYRRDVDYVVGYGAGTLARVAGGAIASGASVEVAIVVPPVSSTSAGTTVDLPATARPQPPKVAWIVPTFGWKESTTELGRQRTRTRSGGGLRLFLDRPWFSSGDGEQLAVVLADGPIQPADSQLLGLVTQLGGDPVVTSEAPQQFPTADQFPLATGGPRELTLPELVGRSGTVSVATHDVTWDADRQRWACDIVLPPGRVYQPFIRLVVARYQPHALAGVELSAAAGVEWAQLSPDRSATIVADLLDLTRVKVVVAGRSAGGTDAAPLEPNRVSVILQTSTASNPGDLDWTTVGAADGQRLAAAIQTDGRAFWAGTLTLPTARLFKPYRLIITEHEQYRGGGRLVYSDVVRL